MSKKLKLSDDDLQAAMAMMQTKSMTGTAKAIGVKFETLRAALNRAGYNSETRADGWDVVSSSKYLRQSFGAQP